MKAILADAQGFLADGDMTSNKVFPDHYISGEAYYPLVG
jgi:hypothetical protein